MILITGATGFLGSRMARRLVEMGKPVICLKRTTSDCGRIKDVRNRCVWFDVDRVPLEDIFENNPIQIIIHCAVSYGKNEGAYFEVYESNLVFPLKLLKLAVQYKCPYFINTDSYFVKDIETLCENNIPVYMNAYTKSKYLFTYLARDNIKNMDIAFINMRLEHIYGPGDSPEKFTAFLLKKLLKQTDEVQLTKGDQKRDWIYLEDVVSAFETIVTQIERFEGRKYYLFQVGTSKAVSLKEFAETAKRISGSSTRLLFGAREMAARELMYSCADNRDLCRLGWQPQYTLEEGLLKYIEEMRGQ